MKKIIYYVATSLDGFIAGPDEDISKFIGEGNGVDRYLQDLQDFKTVIMGKRTYEFGYKFGLEPGQPAYPHMDHYIFSDTLTLDNRADQVHIEKPDLNRVKEIRKTSETDIYLCGGGQFAGWLLDNGMIDQLKLKVNPIVLGDGIRLFGASKTAVTCHLTDQESYEHGLQFLTYRLE